MTATPIKQCLIPLLWQQERLAVHTALLLYKAKALRGLGLLDAARETLTGALRRRKGRSEELLRALRYEGVLVYEDVAIKIGL